MAYIWGKNNQLLNEYINHNIHSWFHSLNSEFNNGLSYLYIDG